MRAERVWRGGIWALAALLAGCGSGGGGGGSSPPPPTPVPAPTGLTYSTPPTLVVGTAITALSPTVTGTVTGYSVNPALPAGLAINATTGVISGTPTAAAAAASYAVTASNSGGSTSANVSITVNDVAPSASYPRTQLRYAVGSAISPLAPATTGGAVVSWSVTPALPAGLALNTTNGTISGTPSAVKAAATYVVRATNSGGHSDVNLNIAVESGVLLDLGHAVGISLIEHSGVRILSLDTSGHWNLWHSTSAAQIASGDTDCDSGSCSTFKRARLAGNTLVVRSTTGFDVHEAVDGDRTANFAAAASWWDLASDGSYFCAGTSTDLTCWDPAGVKLFTRPGNYGGAKAFAAAGAIRVAAGPAGASVIETIAVPSGTATTGAAFQGQFHSWFLDGGRFLTNLNNTVWTYSAASVQQDVDSYPSVSNLTGQGNYLWLRSNATTLKVYAAGGGATAVSSYTIDSLSEFFPSGPLLGVVETTNSVKRLSVIDLSGASPSITTLTPIKYPYMTSFGAASATEWVVGNSSGVLFDIASSPGNTRLFSLGNARAIAGSSTRVAVATASGTIFFYKADTLLPDGQLDVYADQVALSDDGSVLALRRSRRDSQYGDPDWSTEVYALPAMSLTRKWTSIYPSLTTLAENIALSGSGTTLAQLTRNNGRTVDTISPAANIWSDQYTPSSSGPSPDVRNVFLSPSGSRSATPDGKVPWYSTASVVRQGASVVTAIPGIVTGWTDESKVLLNIYVPDFRQDPVYDHAEVFTYQGTKQATLPLPEIKRFQVVSGTSIYAPDRNKIYSLIDGSVVWSSSSVASSPLTDGPSGAVAGGRVIFWSGPRVRAEPY